MTAQDLRAAFAAAGATLLGAFALSPVFATKAWLPPVLAVVLTVLVGGLVLRTVPAVLWQWVRPGRPVPRFLAGAGVAVLPLVQLGLLGCVLTALYAPERALLGVLPTPAGLGALREVFADGAAELREQATPALPLTGLLALSAVLVGLIAVAVDLVAVGGRQAGLAGLGLLVLFCVPVSTISGGIGLAAIAGPAAGLAVLLWADQSRLLARRHRPERRSLLGAGTVTAVRTGLIALATGLVVGALVPTLPEGALAAGGFGTGSGPGGSLGTALDPVAALQGQLTRPEPIDLLRMDASVADPGYLRAVALDSYDGVDGWTLTNLNGEQSVADDSELAPLSGREDSRLVTASIQVIDHDDRFLPVLNSPLRVEVLQGDNEDWRFDIATSTVFGRGVTSRALDYRVTAREPRPTAEQLTGAAPLPADSPIQEQYTALPDLHVSVTELVAQLTDGLTSPYERVRAIHRYFTDRSNGFLYSLATEPGTSGDDLADFLRLKRGYCEQFAGAMAVLVRAAGVPARVALGYTPGEQQRDGSRLITSDDAHAWVEVYFDELGWVPFDPTPISGNRAVDLPWAPDADEAVAGDQAAGPAPAQPSLNVPSARLDRDDRFTPLGTPSQQAAGWVAPVLTGGAALLLLAGLLAIPWALRARQRRARLSSGEVAALWDELLATARDLGMRLPPAATPRQVARQLAEAMTGGPAPAAGASSGKARVRRPESARDAVDALRRLALAEEAASYGRPGSASGGPELVRTLRAAVRGLWGSAGRRRRMRAWLWPESLVRGAGARLAGRVRGLLPRRRRPRPA